MSELRTAIYTGRVSRAGAARGQTAAAGKITSDGGPTSELWRAIEERWPFRPAIDHIWPAGES